MGKNVITDVFFYRPNRNFKMHEAEAEKADNQYQYDYRQESA